MIDEVAIAGRPEVEADPQEPVEGDTRVASSVPTDFGTGREAIIRSGGSNEAEKARRAEFVEIALDMGLAQAVVNALGPGLEVGEHAVNPAQDLVRAGSQAVL